MNNIIAQLFLFVKMLFVLFGSNYLWGNMILYLLSKRQILKNIENERRKFRNIIFYFCIIIASPKLLIENERRKFLGISSSIFVLS